MTPSFSLMAYEALITDPEIPHSIYERLRERDCAVEFRPSPRMLALLEPAAFISRAEDSLQKRLMVGCGTVEAWNRRQSTKFNGVSYIVHAGVCPTRRMASKTKALVSSIWKMPRFVASN